MQKSVIHEDLDKALTSNIYNIVKLKQIAYEAENNWSKYYTLGTSDNI